MMGFRQPRGSALIIFLFAVSASASSTLDKIERARKASRLTADQAILLKAQSLKSAQRLAEFQSDEPIPERCATRITLEALRNWNSYSPSTQTALSQLLVRPFQELGYTSPDGYFLIHYDTAGSEAVPVDDSDLSAVPDYVENLARYADSSWRKEVIQMGYLPPPTDGDGKYDIYTQEIPYYGYTEGETPGPAPWNDYTSFIVVHRNFLGFPPNNDPEGPQKGAMKVTIAHEFHHAVQFAYSAFNQTWFYEVTSTWMENVVFDEVDDNYNYLYSFFSQPQTSLTDESIHMYGSFIWNSYLAQNFGADLIRQAWQANISTPATTSLDNVLAGHGSNLRTEYGRFTLWNYYTGGRDDGLHYEEGSFYPLMNLHGNSGGSYLSGTSPSLLPMAAAYETFPSNNTIEKIRLTFSGSANSIWNAHLVLDGPPGTRANPLGLISSRMGDTTIFDTDSFSTVTLIGAQTKMSQLFTPASFNYTYQAFRAYLLGDLNKDSLITSSDVVLLLNYVFLGILPPENHLEAADLDCNGIATSSDVVQLLNYTFLGTVPPCGP